MAKITKAKVKSSARKIRNATEEQFDEMQKNYQKVMGNVNNMTAPGLLFVSFIGIAIILLLDSALFDLIGLLVLIYPFYLFAQKTGHHDGYCEGYYDHMTKDKNAEDADRSDKKD
ncbi:MAG TPA: hypothetical protein PLH22_01565 [Candidatus Colwellbacteria bacterium]|jgi:hypothetical protein|nr:hypothetical protein [Candidatus Colwellbacteria bacterium]